MALSSSGWPWARMSSSAPSRSAKNNTPRSGCPPEPLAVFQIGLGAGEQRAGQKPVQRVMPGHLADGGGAAAEVHAPPADGQARVKAGVAVGRGRQRGAGLLVGLGGALYAGGVAAGGVHVHREQVQRGERAFAGRGKSVPRTRRRRWLPAPCCPFRPRRSHTGPCAGLLFRNRYNRLKKAWRPLMAGGAARRDTAAAAATLSA